MTTPPAISWSYLLPGRYQLGHLLLALERALQWQLRY